MNSATPGPWTADDKAKYAKILANTKRVRKQMERTLGMRFFERLAWRLIDRWEKRSGYRVTIQ